MNRMVEQKTLNSASSYAASVIFDAEEGTNAMFSMDSKLRRSCRVDVEPRIISETLTFHPSTRAINARNGCPR